MKPFTHISKQWLVSYSLVKNWRRFVLAWLVRDRQFKLRYPQSGGAIRLSPIVSYALLWMVILPAQAVSFDCDTAKTPVDKIICDWTKGIYAKDDDLNNAYEWALMRVANQQDLIKKQRYWIKNVRNRCKDEDCLWKVYDKRMDELNALKAKACHALPVPKGKTITGHNQPICGNTPQQTLFPFRFTDMASLDDQKDKPICQDFLEYLNNPRSNRLFNEDGTLVKETDKFKSVKWETLDKSLYRQQYLQRSKPEHLAAAIKYYDNPEMLFQRTVAHGMDEYGNKNPPKRWLYRLVSKQPMTRERYSEREHTHKTIEVPTFFYGMSAQIGDEHGNPYPVDHSKYTESVDYSKDSSIGGDNQLFEYLGKIYEINNMTFTNDAKPKPKTIDLRLLEIDVAFPREQLFDHWTCSYEAHNEQ